ncbi:helicase/secretion neighborhood TadE-like protein [Bacillus freudenreichii]|nr:helicase/secretion neighborhood TadE-like protein [Bacillus freudenreichii]
MKSILNNERGNAALFMIGLLAVMMIMFVFVLNLSKVLAVKEQANTTAQQASLAATSVLYEEIWDSIEEYENDLIKKLLEGLDPEAGISILDLYPKTIEERVDEETVRIQSANPEESHNEARRKAINQVVTEEIQSEPWGYMLRDQLDRDIRFHIIKDMKDAARATINDNGGNTSEAEISIFHNDRIYVRASNDVETTAYGNFLKGIKKKLFQESAGPKIDFVKFLPIKETHSLD